jgi:NAD(P)-dependent dehydrogenase (short-subunit alcohol dehydrogenase family)
VTDTPLDGRVAVVTGASRGIGYAAALGLAKAGAHVIATARTEGGLTDLDDAIRAATGKSATLVPLDLKDGSGIDTLGAAIFERWGRLDILVSNAGELGLITPTAQLEPRTWDRTIAINLTANYRLIRSFDPLFRRAEAARAIFVTTGLVPRPRAFWGAYAASKAGLEALVRVYADETEHTKIRPLLLDPGPVRTRMRATAFPGEDPDTLPPPDALAPLFVELARSDVEPAQMRVSFREWAAAGGRTS